MYVCMYELYKVYIKKYFYLCYVGTGFYLSPISFLKDPVVWIHSLSKYQATHTQAPNFAYALSTRKFNEYGKGKYPSLNLSSLQHMINAAEPVDVIAIEEFYSTFSSYGLSFYHFITPSLFYTTYMHTYIHTYSLTH